MSDIHYSVPTLKLADAAMRQALDKANELEVPLIVSGDLHDSKANMRAECVNAMIETFKLAHQKPYVLVGNHDKINEKSAEHSINFLDPYCHLIDNLRGVLIYNHIFCIPYHHDVADLLTVLRGVPKGSTIIMHQGIEGSHSGEYLQDKSAITKQDVAGLRVISGHYHRRQDIELPNGGLWSYVGNPYTLNFGEASDPEKGFQILMDDGSLEFVPTNLREHVVIDCTVDGMKGEVIFLGEERDLVWVKLRGSKQELSKWTKTDIATNLDIIQDFRLELIHTDSEIKAEKQNLSQGPLLDLLIDSLSDASAERKRRLKTLWKNLC